MRRYSVRRLMARVAVAAAACAAAAWVVRAAQESWVASASAGCAGNLAQVAVALHTYHDVYGRFPPAYLADASGRPRHSWRVLLLPYISKQMIIPGLVHQLKSSCSEASVVIHAVFVHQQEVSLVSE